MQKSYNRNQCGYSCNRPSKLEIHLRVSIGGKAFVCSQRNYSCTEAGTLKVHMRIHSGENPYSWMQCDYSCTRASILKQHLLTHSGEKQFQCTQYISSFAKSTCQLIQGKSISAVTSATIYATMLEVSRDISSSILVKNPMHAISAVSLAAI